MGGRILVTYATRYGATGEVAQSVADVLRSGGHDVDVKACSDVKDLGEYRAVVVGAPFYIGKMLKGATEFLEGHKAALQSMPVAIFSLGPLRASDDMEEAREQLDGLMEKTDWLKPVAAEMFVGAYDPGKLRWLDKLAALPPASPLHGLGAHDDRDWDAIHAWAAQLPSALALS